MILVEGTPDLGRIVGLIMENPKLIEEISRLAHGEASDGEKPPDSAASEKVEGVNEAEAKPEAIQTVSAPEPKRRRTELLCALKPYVSKERAQAIDSMITVVEILDTMKRR